MWTYSYHRFGNKAAYTRALNEARWAEGYPAGVSLDEIGTLYEPAVTVELDPLVSIQLLALPGYHVNAAWLDVEMPARFASAQLEPNSPSRVFAGAPVAVELPAVPEPEAEAL